MAAAGGGWCASEAGGEGGANLRGRNAAGAEGERQRRAPRPRPNEQLSEEEKFGARAPLTQVGFCTCAKRICVLVYSRAPPPPV